METSALLYLPAKGKYSEKFRIQRTRLGKKRLKLKKNLKKGRDVRDMAMAWPPSIPISRSHVTVICLSL